MQLYKSRRPDCRATPSPASRRSPRSGLSECGATCPSCAGQWRACAREPARVLARMRPRALAASCAIDSARFIDTRLSGAKRERRDRKRCRTAWLKIKAAIIRVERLRASLSVWRGVHPFVFLARIVSLIALITRKDINSCGAWRMR